MHWSDQPACKWEWDVIVPYKCGPINREQTKKLKIGKVDLYFSLYSSFKPIHVTQRFSNVINRSEKHDFWTCINLTGFAVMTSSLDSNFWMSNPFLRSRRGEMSNGAKLGKWANSVDWAPVQSTIRPIWPWPGRWCELGRFQVRRKLSFLGMAIFLCNSGHIGPNSWQSTALWPDGGLSGSDFRQHLSISESSVCHLLRRLDGLPLLASIVSWGRELLRRFLGLWCVPRNSSFVRRS